MTTECHDITTTAGRAEFAYAGQPAWHGLGQQIPEGATVEEVEKAAGMAWTIERSPVLFNAPGIDPLDGMPVIETHTAPKRVVLYRSDTRAPLAVVSPKFREVQPRTALEFFREMTEAGGYTMETAGTMRGGARLFAMVKVAKDFELPGGDLVASRLLFATACDGTMATVVKPTAIRVVCRNTQQLALAFGAQIGVRHNTRFDPKAAQEKLRKICDHFDAYAQAAETMARTKVSASKAEAFITAVLPTPMNGAVQDTRGYKSILALFNGAGMGADLPSANGTLWGLLQAVTQYVDHEVRAGSAAARQESATFGAGEAVKSRALALASE
jgi:phage/plasmid-like protein (TIGR03299 family)